MSVYGTDVDILTGKPLGMIQEENSRKEKEQEENILKNKMEYLDLSASPDGQKLIGIVEGHLAKRIDFLVANDPQAQAYLAILNDLGVKEFQANQAAKTYFAKYMKNR
jgi:hypothetical protein